MTQEEKELLLKDLCPRLYYNVCVNIKYKTGEPCYGKLTPRDIQWFIDSKIENIKPYLRPMSSMTEEEKEKYYNLCYKKEREGLEFGKWAAKTHYYDTIDSIDYLNSIHIDYRGLIPMGLALEAPKNMY